MFNKTKRLITNIRASIRTKLKTRDSLANWVWTKGVLLFYDPLFHGLPSSSQVLPMTVSHLGTLLLLKWRSLLHICGSFFMWISGLGSNTWVLVVVTDQRDNLLATSIPAMFLLLGL